LLSLTLAAIAIALVALFAHLAGGALEYRPGPFARALDTRWAVAVVFVCTWLVLRITVGSSHPVPVVQDEMAYVLQAQIFAQGRWTVPSPPIPAFWEQPQVLVQPAVAAKYFPGHALVLSLGVIAGRLVLVPLLLQSLAGALLFALARRVSGAAVALLAWVLWLGAPMVVHYGASFFSETTSGVCWLAGWYALLRWRESRRTGWIMGVAAAVGWCVITRPLTGVAYALPVILVVSYDVVRLRRWRDLAAGMAVGLAVLAIIPLWSARTTGQWRVTPQLLYTRQYRPYDVPGFGLDTTKPLLAISPELERLNSQDYLWHREHVPAALPRELVARWQPLSIMIWGSTGGAFLAFALLGLLTLRRETAFAVGSSVLLLLAHLSFAGPPPWTVYYYESVPGYAYLTAAGVAWAAALFGRPRGRPGSAGYDWRSPRWTAPLAAATAVMALATLFAAQWFGLSHRQDRVTQNRFAIALATVPDSRAIVFVRYLPDHDANVQLVRNSAHLDAERLWVVRDLGAAENARLLAMAPTRVPYMYFERTERIFRYQPPARR
jgi:hypothetical protein